MQIRNENNTMCIVIFYRLMNSLCVIFILLKIVFFNEDFLNVFFKKVNKFFYVYFLFELFLILIFHNNWTLNFFFKKMTTKKIWFCSNYRHIRSFDSCRINFSFFKRIEFIFCNCFLKINLICHSLLWCKMIFS